MLRFLKVPGKLSRVSKIKYPSCKEEFRVIILKGFHMQRNPKL